MIFSASGSPSYKLLFGGVLGQELTDTIRQDEDISVAIQVHKHCAVVPCTVLLVPRSFRGLQWGGV